MVKIYSEAKMVKERNRLMGMILILTFLAGCSVLTPKTNGELKDPVPFLPGKWISPRRWPA